MPVRYTPAHAICLLIAVAISASCSRREERPVTYARALEISRAAAQKHGYDLDKYRLDTFGDPAAGKDKWLIVYLCSGESPPPGCSYMVVIDRKSGASEVFPGE